MRNPRALSEKLCDPGEKAFRDDISLSLVSGITFSELPFYHNTSQYYICGLSKKSGHQWLFIRFFSTVLSSSFPSLSFSLVMGNGMF